MITAGFLLAWSYFQPNPGWPYFEPKKPFGAGGGTRQESEKVMSPRRLAALAALCGTVVLASWIAGGLVDFGSDIENTGAPTEVGWARSDSDPIDAAQAIAMGHDGVSVTDVAIVDADLPDPPPIPIPETLYEQVESANTPDTVQGETTDSITSIETPDECLVAETCIDQYLWSVYQRTPKVDTIKVPEQIKVTVKKKGKTQTVTTIVTKLVDEDFTWKDPKVAQKAGLSLMDYVIGGMDRSFKLR